MLEKQIFHEDFFKFLYNLNEVNPLNKLIDSNRKDMTYQFVNKFHEFVAPEQQKLLEATIQLYFVVLCKYLPRLSENQKTADILQQMKDFLALLPNLCYKYFKETFIEMDPKTLIQLIFSCPEANTRKSIVQLILFCINLLIEYYKLSLLAEEAMEDEGVQTIKQSVIDYLNNFLALLPEAAKNWTKLNEYFEFWKDFANSGQVQLDYLFEKDIISLFIDFCLESNSPLVGNNNSEKKSIMGNNYYQPQFNNLVEVVCKIGRHGFMEKLQLDSPMQIIPSFKQQFSESTMLCLKCQKFYEKCAQNNYSINDLSKLIRHFSFNSQEFSEIIAEFLLNSFKSCIQSEAHAYLTLMGEFINTTDDLIQERIEYVFGFPQNIINFTKQCQAQFKIKGGLNCQVIEYISTLNDEQAHSALLNLIYSKHKTYAHLCIAALEKVLQLIKTNERVRQYVTKLPSPDYLFVNYLHWCESFIKSFEEEINEYQANGYAQQDKIKMIGEMKEIILSLDNWSNIIQQYQIPQIQSKEEDYQEEEEKENKSSKQKEIDIDSDQEVTQYFENLFNLFEQMIEYLSSQDKDALQTIYTTIKQYQKQGDFIFWNKLDIYQFYSHKNTTVSLYSFKIIFLQIFFETFSQIIDILLEDYGNNNTMNEEQKQSLMKIDIKIIKAIFQKLSELENIDITNEQYPLLILIQHTLLQFAHYQGKEDQQADFLWINYIYEIMNEKEICQCAPIQKTMIENINNWLVSAPIAEVINQIIYDKSSCYMELIQKGMLFTDHPIFILQFPSGLEKMHFLIAYNSKVFLNKDFFNENIISLDILQITAIQIVQLQLRKADADTYLQMLLQNALLPEGNKNLIRYLNQLNLFEETSLAFQKVISNYLWKHLFATDSVEIEQFQFLMNSDNWILLQAEELQQTYQNYKQKS